MLSHIRASTIHFPLIYYYKHTLTNTQLFLYSECVCWSCVCSVCYVCMKDCELRVLHHLLTFMHLCASAFRGVSLYVHLCTVCVCVWVCAFTKENIPFWVYLPPHREPCVVLLLQPPVRVFSASSNVTRSCSHHAVSACSVLGYILSVF